MKDFAKDLITIEEGDTDDPLMQQFLQSQREAQLQLQSQHQELKEIQIPNAEIQSAPISPDLLEKLSIQKDKQISNPEPMTEQENKKPEQIQTEIKEDPIIPENINILIEGVLQDLFVPEDIDKNREKIHSIFLQFHGQNIESYNKKIVALQDQLLAKEKHLQSHENKLIDNAKRLTEYYQANEDRQNQIGQQPYVNMQDKDPPDQLLTIFSQFQSKLTVINKSQMSISDFEITWKNSQRNNELIGLIQSILQGAISQILKERQQSQKLQETISVLQENVQVVTKRDQQAINDNSQLQKRFTELQEKLNVSLQQQKEKENRIKEIEKNYQDNDKKKRELIEEVKSRSQEITSLKQKLQQGEKENANLIQYMQQMQKEFKLMIELKAELEQKDQEIEHLSGLLEEWQLENQQLQQGIQNIQLLNEQEERKREQLQNKYENDIKKAKVESIQHDTLMRKNYDLNLEMNVQKKKFEDLSQDYSLLELKLQKQNLQTKELEKEVHAFNRKIKNDQSYQSNMVDRRVVSKFLLNYFDASVDYQVKMQILETLASILNLSEEEKLQIGYIRMAQNSPSMKQDNNDAPYLGGQKGKDSFQSKLIGFLTNDDK